MGNRVDSVWSGGALHFSGTHTYSVDAKGRVAIPSRFREQMARAGESELVLAPALREPHLKLYPGSSWSILREKIDGIGNPLQRQAVRRAILSRAHEVSTDGQGRILVPQLLRAFAEITDDVVVVGDGDHVQFWSPAHWDKALGTSIENIVKADALLADLGY